MAARRRPTLAQLVTGIGVLGGLTSARAHPSVVAPAVDAPLLAAPSFPIGGPTSAAWREEMLTKAHELAGLATWIAANRDETAPPGDLLKAVSNQLRTARLTAAGRDTRGGEGTKRLRWWTRMMSSSGGASFERTLGNLDSAEVSLLRLAPAAYLQGQLPGLQAHVNRYLPKDDPRRTRVAEVTPSDELSASDRNAIVAAYHAANSQRRRDLLRLRSFRNLLAGATVTLLALAVGVAVLAEIHPNWFPVCFFPGDQHKFVCPLGETSVPNAAAADVDDLTLRTATGADVLLVEILGLIAATLAGALALRRMRGTSTPYGVPVALILLKLPTGSLTALLGLLFMRGGFVPGLTALDSTAQILAWAIVFGYSQQVFTRLIDSQGNDLLHDVAGYGAAGDRPTRAR
jgi:hypothetical protein